MDKLKASADPLAAIIANLIGILGVLGMLSKWGMSADQAAMVGGFVLGIAAAIRSIYNRRQKPKDSPSPPSQKAP